MSYQDYSAACTPSCMMYQVHSVVFLTVLHNVHHDAQDCITTQRACPTKGKTHFMRHLGCSTGYATCFAMLPDYSAECMMCFMTYLDCAVVSMTHSVASQHTSRRGWKGSGHQGQYRRRGIMTQPTRHERLGC